MGARATGILLLHGLVGWALCGAVMGLGPLVMSMKATLIVHAIAAPFIFAAISWVYFTRFGYTRPLPTALTFVAFALAMDAVVVSALIMGDFAMFASFGGTWLPLALIAIATYLTGLRVRARAQRTAVA